MSQEVSRIEKQIVNFLAATTAGALCGTVTKPDTYTDDALDSVAIGIIDTLLVRYVYNIPLLNVLYRQKYSSIIEVLKDREPSGVAGFMLGQTIVKYLKQGSF